ncbi:growth/differentiation factor 2 [Spinachia spinachia]
MQNSRSFLLQFCLCLVVCMGFYTCKPFNNEIQSEDHEGLYQLSEEDLLEEEEDDFRMQDLLGTMKEGFLRKLNLSDVPQENSKICPPQFMIELYNKYASNDSENPQSDVIRSFTVQDIPLSVANGTKSRHRLHFNISIPNHEKITTAKLQLFFFPGAGAKVTSHNVMTTIKVYEVDYNNFTTTTEMLLGKVVTGFESTWETFDVTTAMRRWIESGYGSTAFDVVVDGKDCAASKDGEEGGGCLNLSVSVGENTSAALIVFSDDLGSKTRETRKELREMILHEEETILHSGANWNGEDPLQNEIPQVQHPQRQKRKAEREYCRRTSLKVNFKDIGWDSWIVAPPEYDAFECRGLCYHPLTDESTPSKHALIQTLMNIKNPKKANMACCVPIKLDSIPVMYQENGRLTIRYLYEEMKVAECGCR